MSPAFSGAFFMANTPFIANSQALRDLVDRPHTKCQCSLERCAGLESVNDAQWPLQQLQMVGTLRDPEVYEPSYEEHHPKGTRYESVDAPVSAKHFPYNRCDVFFCKQCAQHVLRYTEFGGYYVDPRGRRITADLIDQD
jgi:hypothetical protein